MRFHDLRHSHVALLIAPGTHPAVIAARLGHTSVRTVLDVYGSTKASTEAPPTPGTVVGGFWCGRDVDAAPLNGPRTGTPIGQDPSRQKGFRSWALEDFNLL